MSALAGVRVVITRAPHQTGEFETLLRKRGAVPLLYPCIDIAPPQDSAALDAALHQLADFDWIVLTSANTVIALAQRLNALDIPVSALHGLKVAAVGTATADAARDLLGVETSVMPDEFIAEALAGALGDVAGARIFLPQSAIAETTLRAALTAAGAQLTVVDAYETIIGSGGVDLPALLAARKVDVITLTSSSTVTNLLTRLRDEGAAADALANVVIASIGPKTTATAQKNGLPVTIMPADHTIDGLIRALENYFAGVENAHS